MVATSTTDQHESVHRARSILFNLKTPASAGVFLCVAASFDTRELLACDEPPSLIARIHRVLLPKNGNTLNSFVRGGDWHNLVILYDGGDIAIGIILDVLLNCLIVGWALFIIIKVNNPTQRTIESGVNMIRESVNPMQVIDGD